MDSKQIAAALMKNIVSGVYAAEGCLPGENALARTYGVARMTMRGILEDFRRQGLITRRKGARSVLTQHGSRKSGILGLVVPDYDKFEFFATLRNHLESLCSRIGYRLELVSTDCVSPNAAAIDMRKKVRQLAIRRAEGVIFRPFVSPDFAKSNAELARILRNAEIPVVLIDSDIVRPPKRSDFDLVAVDNVDAGRLLAAHLLETGRRRIAFMTSGHPATANDNWRNRLFGLAGELSVLGANEGVRTLPFPSAGPNAVRKLMKGRAAPQAIVCGNDETAVRLIRRLKEAGYSVPEDVAVAGFDDADCARSSIPPLTTIHQPTETIARSALRLLLERIRLPKGEARTVYLATPLVRRRST